jgi:hypothetical protein
MRTLSRLAPVVLVLLVVAMVALAAVVLYEAAPHILPDAAQAVERVSGSY